MPLTAWAATEIKKYIIDKLIEHEKSYLHFYPFIFINKR